LVSFFLLVNIRKYSYGTYIIHNSLLANRFLLIKKKEEIIVFPS